MLINFFFCVGKAEFSAAITPVLSHDPLKKSF